MSFKNSVVESLWAIWYVSHVFNGPFHEFKQYAPRWAIRATVWSVIVIIVSQGVYTGYKVWLWFLTPLAKDGWTADEYAKLQILLSTSESALLVVVLLCMIVQFARMEWRQIRLSKLLKDRWDEDSLKQNYLFMFQHAEDHHPEIWNEIIDELNEKRKKKYG